MEKIKQLKVWNINTDKVLLQVEVGACFVENIETHCSEGGSGSVILTLMTGETQTYNYPSDKVYNYILTSEEV